MTISEFAQIEHDRLLEYYKNLEEYKDTQEEIQSELNVLNEKALQIIDVLSDNVDINYFQEVFERVNRLLLKKPLSPIQLQEVDDWELEHQKDFNIYYTHKFCNTLHKKTNSQDLTSKYMDTAIFKVIEVIFDEEGNVIDNVVLPVGSLLEVAIPKSQTEVMSLKLKTHCEIKSSVERYYPMTETFEFLVRKIKVGSEITNEPDIYILLEPMKIESFRKMYATIFEDILVIPAPEAKPEAKEQPKIIQTKEWRRK